MPVITKPDLKKIAAIQRERWKERKATAAPQKAATTAASSPRNGAKNGSHANAEQGPGMFGRGVSEAMASIDDTKRKAMAAAGCQDEASFKRLPKEEQNAFLAEARGAEIARGSGVTGALLVLDPNQVQRSRFNRDDFDKEALAELIEDVKLRGVLQPGIVRPLRPPVIPKSGVPIVYELIAGERRWRAATAAGRKFPAIERDCTDTEALELQAVENMHREDLNPIDEATKYEQLLTAYEAEGLTRTKAIERIEEKTGKAQSTIYERLALMKLPSNVRVLVKPGFMPASHAALLTKLRDPKTAIELASEILKPKKDEAEGGVLSFRATKHLVEWHVKREANLARWQSEADDFAKKGWRVLTAAQSEKVVKCHDNGGDWWWLEDSKTYAKADDTCNLPGANWKEFQQLWKKAPAPVLARLPDGRPVHIYLRGEAEEAVRTGGKLGRKTQSRSSGMSAGDRLKLEHHKRRARDFESALGGIVKSVETSLDSAQFWQWFAQALVGQWRSDPIRRLCKRRGWKRATELKAKLDAMGVAELRGVCAEILLYNDVPSMHGSDWGKAVLSACRLTNQTLPGWKNAGEKADLQASGGEEEEDETDV